MHLASEVEEEEEEEDNERFPNAGDITKPKRRNKQTQNPFLLWCGETTVDSAVGGDTSAAADMALELQTLDENCSCCCCCRLLPSEETPRALLN
jgi:hypothetical protein